MKEYLDAATRAEFAWRRFRTHFGNTILDVGAGGSSLVFRPLLGKRYLSADISNVRATPDVLCDFERRDLPFRNSAVSTVFCFDVMEHVDSPHALFDECARVAGETMIVALPNNWPGMLWDLVRGHNISRRGGYGLPPIAPPPGHRHKWFFNIEEGEQFLRASADRNGLDVVECVHVFERGNDSIIRIDLLRRFGIPGYPAALALPHDLVKQKRPRWYPAFLVFKYGVCTPLRFAEELIKRLVWGVGAFRYDNMFCRQLWVVMKKRPDPSA